MSNSSSDSSVWKYSLNSSIGVWPRTMYWRSPSLRMFYVFVDVVLVVDVADDLFDDVLDGDEARDAAVFVRDDRHVHARAAQSRAAAR